MMLNEYSPITIVAAITSKFDEPLYPTEVLIQAPEFLTDYQGRVAQPYPLN